MTIVGSFQEKPRLKLFNGKKLLRDSNPRTKQLAENKGRKTGRKLTRRIIIECKFVE